jgi:hypothetical protein
MEYYYPISLYELFIKVRADRLKRNTQELSSIPHFILIYWSCQRQTSSLYPLKLSQRKHSFSHIQNVHYARYTYTSVIMLVAMSILDSTCSAVLHPRLCTRLRNENYFLHRHASRYSIHRREYLFTSHFGSAFS